MSLQVREVSAAGYRSLQRIRFPIDRLSVFLGANGVGKTNLYRALQLLQAAAVGSLSQELAAEGGMESALWAGKRSAKEPVRIALQAGFGAAGAGGSTFDYAVEVGAPICTAAAFPLEPQVKDEVLSFLGGKRPVKLLERRGPALTARDESGARAEFGLQLLASETALGSLEDPARFPDLHLVRRTMLDWRFYHDFRTDAQEIGRAHV